MIRKTAVISLILSLLFGLAGINELPARDSCSGKCCCTVPEATDDSQDNSDLFFGLIPVCGCCQNQGLISCGDLQKTGQTAPAVAFSQESNQRTPATQVVFALIFRVADPPIRPAVTAQPDRLTRTYRNLPIYLCNLSLLI